MQHAGTDTGAVQEPDFVADCIPIACANDGANEKSDELAVLPPIAAA